MVKLDRNSRFVVFFLIAQMAFFPACTSAPKYEGSTEQYDDIVITTKVHEAIIDEPSLRPFEINVRTVKGVVELSGTLNSRDDIDKALAVARGVSGIRFIKNDMRTQGTGDY